MANEGKVAYFSMEIAVEPNVPTYSGGLGVLAGDTIRAAADLHIPMIGITLLYRKGYFYQILDNEGWQREQPVEWVVADYMTEVPQRTSISIEGRTVAICAYLYKVVGVGGYEVPVYFLDTDLPENAESDRALTHYLYGGDQRYRLCQELILGAGGIRMLQALGYDRIEKYHMNEGHASFLTWQLLADEARKAGSKNITHGMLETVRSKCVFTTHTPVPAGHDRFPLELVSSVIGDIEYLLDYQDPYDVDYLKSILQRKGDTRNIAEVLEDKNTLNMTYLALALSCYVNGVAKRHQEVSQLMFRDYVINEITNGVHAATWASKPFQELYDRHIQGWRQDNFSLRYALSIPKEEVWNAHMATKKHLLQYVNRQTNAGLDINVLTIGFARRAATYKRADLLFRDTERLRSIASASGLQIIFAGKTHPQDQEGKELIHRIFQIATSLRESVKIAYIGNYDMTLGRLLTSGVDIWLNTPQPPLEASGTSCMKAAVNGVPSLSILDGWWIEGCIEGLTGWAIGTDPRMAEEPSDSAKDALSLYEKLEKNVVPLFYDDRNGFINVMLHSMALNGSFFNTHRMIQQYVLGAYFS